MVFIYGQIYTESQIIIKSLLHMSIDLGWGSQYMIQVFNSFIFDIAQCTPLHKKQDRLNPTLVSESGFDLIVFLVLRFYTQFQLDFHFLLVQMEA